MAKKTSKKSSEKKPVDPADFGDLPPIEPAPDVVKKPAKAEEPEPEPEPEPKALEPDELKEIVLSTDDVMKALKAGDWSGLPSQKGQEPEVSADGEGVVLVSRGEKITANIAGHAVEAFLKTETKLSAWHVIGSVKDLSGKWRLVNDVTMAIRGQVVRLKAGKEFFDHQLSVDLVRQAGGICLPIGTQK